VKRIEVPRLCRKCTLNQIEAEVEIEVLGDLDSGPGPIEVPRLCRKCTLNQIEVEVEIEVLGDLDPGPGPGL
jgi:hypothetical protein